MSDSPSRCTTTRMFWSLYTSIICRLQTRELASIVCSHEQVDLFCILQASTGTCVRHTLTRGKSRPKIWRRRGLGGRRKRGRDARRTWIIDIWTSKIAGSTRSVSVQRVCVPWCVCVCVCMRVRERERERERERKEGWGERGARGGGGEGGGWRRRINRLGQEGGDGVAVGGGGGVGKEETLTQKLAFLCRVVWRLSSTLKRRQPNQSRSIKLCIPQEPLAQFPAFVLGRSNEFVKHAHTRHLLDAVHRPFT